MSYNPNAASHLSKFWYPSNFKHTITCDYLNYFHYYCRPTIFVTQLFFFFNYNILLLFKWTKRTLLSKASPHSAYRRQWTELTKTIQNSLKLRNTFQMTFLSHSQMSGCSGSTGLDLKSSWAGLSHWTFCLFIAHSHSYITELRRSFFLPFLSRCTLILCRNGWG